MAPNARIDQQGRESVVQQNADVRIDLAGREAVVGQTANLRLDLLGREVVVGQTTNLRCAMVGRESVIVLVSSPPMIIYPLSIPGIGESKANLKKFDAIGENVSPFDGSAQQQQWADRHWELDLGWPEMTWAQFAALDAFSGALHGKLGSFVWGPPLATSPQGTGLGSPVISGTVPSGGPLVAGAGATSAVGIIGATQAWTNPAFVTGTAGYALIDVFPAYTSQFLDCSSFGFALALSSPGIAGVLVTATGYSSAPGVTVSAQLLPGSAPRLLVLPTSPSLISFGGPGDLWGTLGLALSLINSPTFGCSFQGTPGGVIRIQNVQITLFFQPANVSGSDVIVTSGWQPNQTGVLLPGDFLELNAGVARLHQYVGQTPLATDPGGLATIDIWPSVRETVAPGTAVVLLNPQGTFRLAENRRESPADQKKTFSFQLKAREAI